MPLSSSTAEFGQSDRDQLENRGREEGSKTRKADGEDGVSYKRGRVDAGTEATWPYTGAFELRLKILKKDRSTKARTSISP